MKSQAIVAYGKPLEEVVSEIPTPKGTEVVVKITYSGVCHSDVHLQDGHVDLGDGDKIDWSKGRTLPHTLGHEIEGTLASVGPDAPPCSKAAPSASASSSSRGSAAASAPPASATRSTSATSRASSASRSPAAIPNTSSSRTRNTCSTPPAFPKASPPPTCARASRRSRR